jgi:hypothetical protein
MPNCRQCDVKNCNKKASHNLIGLSPICCGEHSEPNMINVVDRKCGINGCLKISYFNLPDEKRGIRCSKHRDFGMINVVTKTTTKKTCQFEGCLISPCYNIQEEKRGILCFEHRAQNMINVISKKCQIQNCNKRASHNLIGLSPIRCGEHSEPNMINVVDRKCGVDGCLKIPYFNLPDEKRGIRCSKHCDLGMIDVVTKTCKNSWCTTYAPLPKYKGYCLRCFIHEFPDQTISRNFKVKERYVTDYLKEEFATYQIIFDKAVGGCSKRRPDAYIDLLTHVIIIEVDENQHKNYDTTCEIARINELYTDLGDRPIVFIRFNPDKYNKQPSCFKYLEKTGVPVIRNAELWTQRLEKLRKCIQKHIENIPEETIFEYLFYDDL